jgi:hypothetical protein
MLGNTLKSEQSSIARSQGGGEPKECNAWLSLSRVTSCDWKFEYRWMRRSLLTCIVGLWNSIREFLMVLGDDSWAWSCKHQQLHYRKRIQASQSSLLCTFLHLKSMRISPKPSSENILNHTWDDVNHKSTSSPIYKDWSSMQSDDDEVENFIYSLNRKSHFGAVDVSTLRRKKSFWSGLLVAYDLFYFCPLISGWFRTKCCYF